MESLASPRLRISTRSMAWYVRQRTSKMRVRLPLKLIYRRLTLQQLRVVILISLRATKLVHTREYRVARWISRGYLHLMHHRRHFRTSWPKQPTMERFHQIIQSKLTIPHLINSRKVRQDLQVCSVAPEDPIKPNLRITIVLWRHLELPDTRSPKRD